MYPVDEITRERAEKPKTEPGNMAGFIKGRILIVEEDVMSRLLIEFILEKNLISFRSFPSIKALLQKPDTTSYALVLAGIDEPEPRMEEIKTLVDTFKKSKIPSLAMTLEKDNRQKLIDAGFTDVLLKPYDPELLLKLIYTHMKDQTPTTHPVNKEQTLTPSFSLESLKRISNNDTAFIVKMLEKFTHSATECVETMQDALLQKDPAKIRSAAHKNIPSYALMGLDDLTRDLEHLEHYPESGVSDGALPRMINSFEQKNRQVIVEIKDCIEQLKEKKT